MSWDRTRRVNAVRLRLMGDAAASVDGSRLADVVEQIEKALSQADTG